MLPCVIHHLRDLRFCNFIRKNATFPNAMLMNHKHNARGFIGAFVEIFAQNGDDEFHRRVIIVQEQHPVHAGFARLRPRARDDGCADLIPTIIATPGLTRSKHALARRRTG